MGPEEEHGVAGRGMGLARVRASKSRPRRPRSAREVLRDVHVAAFHETDAFAPSTRDAPRAAHGGGAADQEARRGGRRKKRRRGRFRRGRRGGVFSESAGTPRAGGCGVRDRDAARDRRALLAFECSRP